MVDLQPELQQRITDLIESDRVVLFMKGTKHFPQCGFSAAVTQILSGLVPKFATVNVLSDPEIREGIKAFSEWPTIPQLYVDGKFVGGCDIVREMFQAGELHTLLGVQAAPAAAQPEASASAPKLTLSDAARRAITEARGDEQGTLRLEVSASFEHALSIDDPAPGDFEIDAGGVVVLVDRQSAPRANGVHIDFTLDKNGGGFTVDNPNEPAQVRQLAPEQLKSLLDAGERLVLLDVRTPEERAIASLPGARLLDDATVAELEALEKTTPLIFHCHHGVRSQAAAERFLRQGWKRVYNLVGGIDAWSQQIDPTLPRY